jgi:cardiolipin synthase
MEWGSEKIYFNRAQYFGDIFCDIDLARSEVLVETYIWEPDSLGTRFVEHLKAAAKRGVRVRFVVDSFGSFLHLPKLAAMCEGTSVQVKAYHTLYIWLILTRGPFRLERIMRYFTRLNKRLHRKLVVIDGETAYAGGFNIVENRDRDTGVRITGNMAVLLAAFSRIWGRPTLQSSESLRHPLIRLNAGRRLRWSQNRELAARVSNAKTRVWITNPYFVPPLYMLQALRVACQNGVDVRLLVSARPDYIFMKWVMVTYYSGLLRYGVRIFEHKTRFVHAKTLIVDDWATVGSSNWNHRSLIHDLEVDVVLSKKETRQVLEGQFALDQALAQEVFDRDLRGPKFLWIFLDFLVRLFRYWF